MTIYKEPQRFQECDEPLDHFGDLTVRTKVLEKGLFANQPDFDIPLTVQLNCDDDLALAIESDMYLKRIVTPKYEKMKDRNFTQKIFHLVNIYLSCDSLPHDKQQQAKAFALSNLNLL